MRYLYLKKYLEYLFDEFGYSVAVRDFKGFVSKDPDVATMLFPFYVHKGPYCIFVKANREMEDRCRLSGNLLMKKCQSSKSGFVTVCYCGYSDYVIPVKYKDEVIAAICVSGFRTEEKRLKPRIDYICKKYNLLPEKINEAYNKSITVERPDFEHIKSVCEIVADFFRMYWTALLNKGAVKLSSPYMNEPSRLYMLSSIIDYIHLHYAEDLSISDIAASCRCSESYISHLFKKNMNRSIRHYTNELRVNEAKKRILSGEQVSSLAGSCGFSDPNYFSMVFKKIIGASPREYKKMNAN